MNCTASVRVSRTTGEKNNSSRVWKWSREFDRRHSGSQVGWGRWRSHSTGLWPPLFSPIPLEKKPPKQSFCTETVQRHQLFRLIDMCSYLHRCCWPSLDFQGSKCNQEKAEFSFGTKPEFVQILHIELLIMCENPFGLKLQTGQREVRETKTEFSNSMHSLLPKEKTFRHIKLWQKQLCKCTWKWAGIFQD